MYKRQLEEDRLYPSIYGEDDEAFEIWNKEVGVPAERITRFYRDPETGECDNFWEHGAGPCGPCSETVSYTHLNRDSRAKRVHGKQIFSANRLEN